VPYSPATGLPIESQTISQMVDRVLALPEGTRIYVLAPVVRGRKGEYRKELAEYLKKGYQRVKIDGAFHEIGEVKPLDKKFTHDIDVVVDRLVVRDDIKTRLADSLEQCLKLAEGMAVVELADSTTTRAKANAGRNENAERMIFSEKFACPVSGFTISEVEPGCSRSTTRSAPARPAAASASSSTSTPTWSSPTRTPPCARAPSRRGRSRRVLITRRPSTRSASTTSSPSTPVEGPRQEDPGRHPVRLRRRRHQVHLRRRRAVVPDQEAVRGRHHQPRPPLQGDRERLGPRGAAEVFHRHSLRRLQRLPAQARGVVRQDRRPAHRPRRRAVGQARRRMVHRAAEVADAEAERDRGPRAEGNPRAAEIPGRRRPGISHPRPRLRHALGGESQRIRLASQIGSGLTGVLYVLDEPSIGLHQRDNARLWKRCGGCATSATP
jgi:excinuclease ABC subunit A